MFEQMKRQSEKLVTIGKNRKFESIPTLRPTPRKSTYSGLVTGIGKVDFYRLFRFRFIEFLHRWQMFTSSFELSNILANTSEHIALTFQYLLAKGKVAGCH